MTSGRGVILIGVPCPVSELGWRDELMLMKLAEVGARGIVIVNTSQDESLREAIEGIGDHMTIGAVGSGYAFGLKRHESENAIILVSNNGKSFTDTLRDIYSEINTIQKVDFETMLRIDRLSLEMIEREECKSLLDLHKNRKVFKKIENAHHINRIQRNHNQRQKTKIRMRKV